VTGVTGSAESSSFQEPSSMVCHSNLPDKSY
jgi:hypothetical protein